MTDDGREAGETEVAGRELAGRDLAEQQRAEREPRPVIERIGLAAVALVLATLFGGVAVASWFGGELFLAAMGGIGCLMTVWVGVLTLIRG
jgi:fatty acid desaturase